MIEIPPGGLGNPIRTDGLTDAQLRASPVGVEVSSNKNLDAFSRLIVAQPATIFDSKLLFDSQSYFWDDQQTSGSGTSTTYNTGQASQTLSVSANTVGTRVRQTFQRFVYQSGRSQGVCMTGILGSAATGITRRIGLFDSLDGLFFESSPTGINIVRRSSTSGSPVDSAVLQSNWNLDKMDGTGASGITIDWSKVQIFCFQYQWLGVGSLWFGVDINSQIYWVHRMDVANQLTTVSMSTPNLPVRYEISNSGTGGAASLTQICVSVFSSGGANSLGRSGTLYRNTVLTTNNNNSWYPLIAVRLKSGFLGTNFSIQTIGADCQSTASYTWRLTLNPTVVGTAFSFTDLTNSAIEYDASTTNANTITGGTDIQSLCTQQTNAGLPATQSISDIKLGASIAGVRDVLVLAVRRDTGTSESFMANINFTESH